MTTDLFSNNAFTTLAGNSQPWASAPAAGTSEVWQVTSTSAQNLPQAVTGLSQFRATIWPPVGDTNPEIVLITNVIDGTHFQVTRGIEGSPVKQHASGDTLTHTITAASIMTALAAKAPLISPALTGTPTAPTAAALDSSTKLATTAYADAASAAVKNYADLLKQGLLPKDSVVAATTAALAANTYANGASGVGATLTGNANGALAAQDGGTLTVNQRLLVKNEATQANNGIYVLTQVGTGGTPYILTRATDADTSAKLIGAYALVEAGTTYADTQWACTNAPATPITFGTTAVTFGQIAGSGSVTGTAPIVVTGSAISLSTVPVASGGTAQITAGAARGVSGIGAATTAPTGAGSGGIVSISALGIGTKVSALIGDASTTAFTITHNLGSQLVTVAVLPHGGGNAIIVDWNPATTNTVVVTFPAAPAASAYDVVITG